MNILYIAITIIITLFLYIKIIKPIYMGIEIHGIEKDITKMIKMAQEIGKKLNDKVINIYNLYKEIEFTKKERELQLQITKILYNYIVQSYHSKEDFDVMDCINGGILEDEERTHDYYSTKEVAGKNAKQLEILFTNLLSYVKKHKQY